MNNFTKPGDTITTVAAGDTVTGDVVQLGQVVAIAANNALTGEPLELLRVGQFSGLVKETGTAWVIGDVIHFNSGTSEFSAAALASGDLIVGYAASAEASGATTGSVVFDGAARVDIP